VGIVAWALIAKYAMQRVVPGWTAIVVVLAIVASAQFLMIGILGEYVGRIYEEVKGRPLYIVSEKIERVTMQEEAPAPVEVLGPPAQADALPAALSFTAHVRQ
jgi:hypothetical protein